MELSLILSIWGERKVYFQWKPQQIICWVHATLTLLRGTWWYSPQLRWATFTGWTVIPAVHSNPSNDSWGYSSVHTYPTRVALPFLTCPGTWPFINTTALPALQSHLLNIMSVLLLGKIWDWLLYKQCSKMAIYCHYCSAHLSPAPNFLLVPCLFGMRNQWIYQYYQDYVQTA